MIRRIGIDTKKGEIREKGGVNYYVYKICKNFILKYNV